MKDERWKETAIALERMIAEQQREHLLNLVKSGQCLRINCEQDCPIYSYKTCTTLIPGCWEQRSSDEIRMGMKRAAVKEWLRIYGQEQLFEEML